MSVFPRTPYVSPTYVPCSQVITVVRHLLALTVNSHTHTHHIPFALHSIFGSVEGVSQHSVMTLTVVMLPTAAPASTQLGDVKHVVASMCVYPHQGRHSPLIRGAHTSHTHTHVHMYISHTCQYWSFLISPVGVTHLHSGPSELNVTAAHVGSSPLSRNHGLV